MQWHRDHCWHTRSLFSNTWHICNGILMQSLTRLQEHMKQQHLKPIDDETESPLIIGITSPKTTTRSRSRSNSLRVNSCHLILFDYITHVSDIL